MMDQAASTSSAPAPTPAPADNSANTASWPQKLRAFILLCKLRVNSLIVFTAVIGMFLAIPPTVIPGEHAILLRVLVAALGIALTAFAAAAINCQVERTIDARMMRTRTRPTVQGVIKAPEVLLLATATGTAGLWILYSLINPLTAWLTLLTFVGYTIIYTLFLKPATPMNIVIGGASGAMPPLLGWTAMTGQVSHEAIALFLIIFVWTPPHFWALACYRSQDYAASGLPMLPITHGLRVTCLHIFLYILMLTAVSLIPVSLGMSGWFYLLAATVLGVIFLYHGFRLWKRYSDLQARVTFRYSITYLALLFAAMLIDHYLLH